MGLSGGIQVLEASNEHLVTEAVLFVNVCVCVCKYDQRWVPGGIVYYRILYIYVIYYVYNIYIYIMYIYIYRDVCYL